MQVHAYRRTEITLISLFGLDLQFAPNPAGHVVCEVPPGRALDRLLGIEEAYCKYDPANPRTAKAAPAPVAAPAPIAPQSNGDDDDSGDNDIEFDKVLLGSEDLPAEFEIAEGVKVTQEALVQAAFERSGMEREEWNLNDADDREALIEREATLMRMAAEEKAQANAAAAAQAAAPAPAPAAPNAETAPAPTLVLDNGTDKVDLGAMSAAKLREFAKANGVKLPGGNSTKVDDLRVMVFKALTAE